MSSWGHGRMALNGAPTSSSSSSSGTPANNNRLHPSCTSTSTSTSTGTGSASCTESDADHEELQGDDHHKDCGHTPDSPLIAAISSISETLAHHSYHHHSLPSSKLGGAMPRASCHANNKQVGRQVEDPRRRLACRNSNGMISSVAIASGPTPRHGEAPVTLERCLSKRDYHAVEEEKTSKRTNSAIAIATAAAAAPVVEMKPSSTVFKPHCSYYNEETPSPSPAPAPAPAPPVRRPSWEEEVRQALTNSSLSGDGGRRHGSAKATIGGGSLQRSATVREHGSSHAMATALLPPTVTKKVAMEGMPAEEMDRFMKINNSKLPDRSALPSKVHGSSGAKRSTWSKVKSPGEQRWEEAEEFERMMKQRSSKHRPIAAAPMATAVADMMSQSMRVQNSSHDGTWNAHRQGGFGNSSSFYRGIDEEDADDEWVPYRRSGGGGNDGQIMYGAEPARRSVGANGFRYSAAASLPPPAGMVLGRSSSLRDPAIGMVMECGACGAPLRHRPQAACCRSHCCPHHAPCPCSAWNEAPPPPPHPLHAGMNHLPIGSKKKFGTTTSSAAGSMIRACRRLFGLAKKNPGHLHHHNQHHHHQLHYDS